MDSSRHALIVSNTRHTQAALDELSRPEDHVDELKRALKRETCGRYMVDVQRNKSSQVVLRCIEKRLAAAQQDDVVLIYLHGNMLMDEEGDLYLATSDTELDDLHATSLPLAALADALDTGSSEHQIVMLDCHYARLALGGDSMPAELSVGIESQLEGNGRNRTILAASDCLHEIMGSGPIDEAHEHYSYTALVVDALRRGRADKDRDGLITVEELTSHVQACIGAPAGLHSPVIHIPDELQGDILFAYARGAKTSNCFVVTPMSGIEGQRAEEVYEQYVKRACNLAGFKPMLSRSQTNPEVVPEILKSLRTAPMVLAYLGAPPWNPNVMIEVGYRLATRLPIVLLREEARDESEMPLPFDIKGHRVVELMDRGEAIERPELIDGYVKDIAKLLMDTANHQPWESPHPVALMTLNRDTGSGSFIESSRAADLLFDAEDGLKGMSLAVVIKKLQDRMPPEQFTAFQEEQDQLVRQLLIPTGFMGRNSVAVPRATRPVVFRKHNLAPQEFLNRKFLPIIVEYSRQGSELQLKLLYLDVSDVTVEEAHDGRHLYRCNLEGPPMRVGNGPTYPRGVDVAHRVA